MSSAWRKRAVVAAVVLGCAVFSNPYIRGDGNGYYAYVRSAVIDHDLKFQNEFRRGDPAFVRSVTTDGEHFRAELRRDVRPGHIRNQWSVGASVLWAPFFVAAHLFVTVVGHWPADGYSFPYRWACAFGTSLYAVAGLAIALRVAAKATNAKAAAIATAAIVGASSIAVYMFFLPFWALALATLPGALVLWLYARGPTWGLRRWWLYGALVGFATITHPLGIAWAALPAVAWFRDRGTARQRAGAAGVCAAGFVVGELPQLAARWVVNANPFDLGYNEQWQFWRPPIVAQFFSAQHGLFTWTPVIMLAFVGLVLLVRDAAQRRLATGVLAALVVLTYLTAANVTPEQSSFGNRMFVHLTPVFVLGLAVVVDRVWAGRRRVVVGGLGVLIVWNALFAFQWGWGLVPKRGAIDWSQMIRQQFTTAPKEIGRVAVRFFTDREGLIREVQERDEEQIRQGRA